MGLLMPLPLLTHTQHDYEHAVTELTLLASDRHGLFSRVAGAMSLAGANILGAKIFTLKNGIAVEIFQITDMAAGVFDQPEKLARLSVNIRQALDGDLDLAEALAGRQRQYRRNRSDVHRVAGQVLIDNEASNVHTVIEVSGRDRSGFLYQVTRAIADLGLSIATAHISTYGVQASDVFYVKDLFGMKITHGGKLKLIRETLLEVVGGESLLNIPARVSQTEP